MNNNSIHWTHSDEYEKINEKVFKVMLSCKTIEHWESAKKFNELAIDYCLSKTTTQFDTMRISSFGSFRRGFIAGMLQSLKEEQRHNGVQDYLSFGC